MEIRNIHLVYFSATYTTRKIVREIARAFGGNVTEHDVTCGLPFGELNLGGEGNLLIAGAPVYAGRLPVRAARAFAMLRGTQTPAIAVSVYGNRDYDDALVETQDIIEAHGERISVRSELGVGSTFSFTLKKVDVSAVK